jgi:hypothetical protein
MAAESSANVKAPNIANTPPTSQMARFGPEAETCKAMVAGTKKIPEASTVPTFTMVASKRPSWRFSSPAGCCDCTLESGPL